jgi:quinol monooxygenase YgiN
VAALIIRTVLQINDGALDRFLDVSSRWVDATKSEIGTAGYYCFVDRAAGRAVFLEHYIDDAAFLAHREAIDPQLRAELYGSAALAGFEVYGDPGPDVRSFLSSATTFGHYRSK